MNTTTHLASINLDDMLADAETALRAHDMNALAEGVSIARKRIAATPYVDLLDIGSIHPSITPHVAPVAIGLLELGLAFSLLHEQSAKADPDTEITAAEQASVDAIELLVTAIRNRATLTERTAAVQAARRILAVESAGHIAA